MLVLVLLNIVLSMLLVAAIVPARKWWGHSGPVAVSGLALISQVVILLGSIILLGQALLTLMAMVVCAIARVSPRRTILVAASVAVVPFAVGLALGIRRAAELDRLRQQYAFESLEPRLAHELASPPSDDGPPKLSSSVEAELIEFEGRSVGGLRPYMLQALHERRTSEFVLAFGFGPVRMLRVHESYLREPDTEAGELPLLRPRDPYGSEPSAPLTAAPDEDWQWFHSWGLREFLDPGLFGYVQSFRRAAGFEPHAMQRDPSSFAESQWTITRLELVSLLKHEEPVAYVSDSLPRMDELGSARTRPLNGFEEEALARLRTDEDLVVATEPGFVRMVGSVRAGKGCLDCHAVQRGELLGAFTYDLHPRAFVESRE